ncbi:hypothetical protein C8R43DRAFT_963300 [Mycena crocata]|nr:hypothetical protein C8R43DRAFT_963300 [Mycena crocata]
MLLSPENSRYQKYQFVPSSKQDPMTLFSFKATSRGSSMWAPDGRWDLRVRGFDPTPWEGKLREAHCGLSLVPVCDLINRQRVRKWSTGLRLSSTYNPSSVIGVSLHFPPPRSPIALSQFRMITPRGDQQFNVPRYPERGHYTAMPIHDISTSPMNPPSPLRTPTVSVTPNILNAAPRGLDREAEAEESFRHRHAANFFSTSSGFAIGQDGYFTDSSSLGMGDFTDGSPMAGQYLDLFSHCGINYDMDFGHPYPTSETSAPSPGGSSRSSPLAETFSAQSPGHNLHDLPPPPGYSTRPHAGLPLQQTSHHYLLPTALDTLTLPRPQYWPGSSTAYQRSSNGWDAAPPGFLPPISQINRCPVSRPRSHPDTLSEAFGYLPTTEDLHRWPQMFSNGMTSAPKKPTLACLFCRERKIGCTRPAEDNPDQTCNQCVRRKRQCVYPKGSRRGQHARHRGVKKLNWNRPTHTVEPVYIHVRIAMIIVPVRAVHRLCYCLFESPFGLATFATTPLCPKWNNTRASNAQGPGIGPVPFAPMIFGTWRCARSAIPRTSASFSPGWTRLKLTSTYLVDTRVNFNLTCPHSARLLFQVDREIHSAIIEEAL